MSHYLLPNTNHNIFTYLDFIESGKQPTPHFSQSFSTFLYDIKKKLDEHEKDWDIFKRYTNPYEYIHTPVPTKKKSVSKHKPLSRSYFKMIEMINLFQLHFANSRSINTFHLAEGPGGFIEAVAHMRAAMQTQQEDLYIGMTILSNDDPNIPAWKKTDHFLKEHKNVYIEVGADRTGNILSLENLVHCKNKYGSTMDFITADGGFDFSMDFNSQEIHIANLLFAQISFAVTMQKKGGSFILKIFDSFMQHTVDLLYLLSSMYNRVYLVKPRTSRYANSEKYVVCKGFIHQSNTPFFPYFYNAFKKMTRSSSLPPPPPSFNYMPHFISRFLMIPISSLFTKKIEEYNAIFGQQQIENIYFTISLIDNKHKQDKIEQLIKANVQKCIYWCTKNNVIFNTLIMDNYNVFLDQYS
uniref:Ribosomal RNA methyltransferase FtsJ domain-containing protein n=1 Tax=viral metagenome TaxID=1070528 RepID=A0A6C0I3L8_9ZZZZ